MVTKFGGQILATKFGFVPDCYDLLIYVNIYFSNFFIRSFLANLVITMHAAALTHCVTRATIGSLGIKCRPKAGNIQ